MTNPETVKPTSYEIDIVPNEHGGFYAKIPDFPSIFTGGETPEEAMSNAQEAIALMIEELRERGQAIPEPLAVYSGRFNVRVPRTLHRELAQHAQRQGVSLNAMINLVLAQALKSWGFATR